MKIHNQCPMCGSQSWQRINVYHSGYSVGKGLIASVFWGEKLGRIIGFAGKKKQTYACRDCHFTMDYQR